MFTFFVTNEMGLYIQALHLILLSVFTNTKIIWLKVLLRNTIFTPDQVRGLVWYEIHETAETAIGREKQIKAWKRQWKLRLIEKNNPEWNDLYDIICEDTRFLPEFIPYLIRGRNDTIKKKSLT